MIRTCQVPSFGQPIYYINESLGQKKITLLSRERATIKTFQIKLPQVKLLARVVAYAELDDKPVIEEPDPILEGFSLLSSLPVDTSKVEQYTPVEPSAMAEMAHLYISTVLRKSQMPNIMKRNYHWVQLPQDAVPALASSCSPAGVTFKESRGY